MTEEMLNSTKSEHETTANDSVAEIGKHIVKTSLNNKNDDELPPLKKPRTSEDFYLFCKFILDHEKYDDIKEEIVNGDYEKQPFDKISSNNGFTESSDDKFDLKLNSDSSLSNSDTINNGENLNLNGNDDVNIKGDDHQEIRSNSSYPKTSEDDVSSDEDSYDLVTCFCGKPFAGRPMIECSECLTWIHLSCVRVRRSNIPDIFICPSCRSKQKP